MTDIQYWNEVEYWACFMTVACIVLLLLFGIYFTFKILPRWIANIVNRISSYPIFHEWEYRNPYDRTCKHCGLHEVNYCWSWDWARSGFHAQGWWEEMYPLAHSPKCGIFREEGVEV